MMDEKLRQTLCYTICNYWESSELTARCTMFKDDAVGAKCIKPQRLEQAFLDARWHSKSECQKGLPEIICLCGSTRFADAFKRANREETLAGNIVLTIGLNLRTDETLLPMPHGMPIDKEELDKIKNKLDELHLRKIDLATKVMILNVGGYIGESTAREIAYAQKIGKPIVYLEPV